MYLEYSKPGVAKILMIKYLQEVLDELPEELRNVYATPVADHLFQERGEEEDKFLEKAQS